MAGIYKSPRGTTAKQLGIHPVANPNGWWIVEIHSPLLVSRKHVARARLRRSRGLRRNFRGPSNETSIATQYALSRNIISSKISRNLEYETRSFQHDFFSISWLIDL